MRVALLASEIGSERGGDETLMRSLLGGLALAAGPDDRFHIYLVDGADTPECLGDDRFSIERIPAGGGMRRYAATMPSRLRRGSGDCDLFFSTTHAPLSSVPPRVLLINDLSFRHYPDHYPPAARLRLNTLVPRQARASRLVVTVSEFSKQDLITEYGLPEDRVLVVPNAIAEPSPPGGEELDRWLADCGVGSPFLLYLGNLHPRKNVARLIEAFLDGRRRSDRLARHQLVIAGARWWGGGEEQAAAAGAPPDSIRFLGRVAEDQKEHLLRSAAIVAYPSLFEGFGLPPLEAMARGTPVLTSNVTSLPETAGDAALLVDPHQVEAIASGLIRLAEDESLRDRLRSAGLERARLYTVRETGERLMEVLRTAIRFTEDIGKG